MRTVFYTVQLLDGFKTTTANVKGLLPDYIREAGFSDVQETGFINTMIGSFCYYEGTKSLKIKFNYGNHELKILLYFDHFFFVA